MIFHSLDFVIFLAAMFSAYWVLGQKWQNRLLLAASLFFYGYAIPWNLTLLVGCAVVAWGCGLGIERYPDRRREFIALSVLVCFGTLGYFKYFGFFLENFRVALSAIGVPVHPPTLQLALPVGISFFTFQAVSYVLDVARGEIRARTNFLDFFLFKAFFPQLVAGPIERATRLLPQIESERRFDQRRFFDAFVLLSWGFFKKVVIADNVSAFSNKIFALEDPTFPGLWAGVFAFAIVIYADFSAYSDIARGAAKLFGFELMKNFEHPYLAHSPQEFWRRWHISLSTWFRDYLYIPLGGSRTGELRTARNILLTFTICGFWHGASWNFLLWGLYHGVLLVLNRLFVNSAALILGRFTLSGAPFNCILAPVKVVGTFLLICIGWLIFRETNLQQLLFDLSLSPLSARRSDWWMGLFVFLSVCFYAFPLFLAPVVEGTWAKVCGRYEREGEERGMLLITAQAVIVGILFFGTLHFYSKVSSDFIYFQF